MILRSLSLTAVAAALVFLTSCSPVESSTDCGYSASYDEPTEGKAAEIMFSLITAESLNGHTNCGFGYVPARVDRAAVGGVTLVEKPREDKWVYLAPLGFDPEKDQVIIHVKDRIYASVNASVKKIDKRVFMSLRPAPPGNE